MPFPDERGQVAVVEYRPEWPAEFELLAGRLRDVLGDLAFGVDHVGSTSVPGLPAKDCIDVQVRMGREGTGPSARFALLFRDYLRADEAARRAWGAPPRPVGALREQIDRSLPGPCQPGNRTGPVTNCPGHQQGVVQCRCLRDANYRFVTGQSRA